MENLKSFFTNAWETSQARYQELSPTQKYMGLAVILGAIIAFISYVVIQYQRRAARQPRFLKGGHIMRQNPTSIPAKQLPIISGDNQVTYFFWMNIKDYEYGFNTYKIVWNRASNILVVLDPTKNNLLVVFINQKAPRETIITVEDIPMKRWCSVAITLNNTNCEIYVNGRLEKTETLIQTPESQGDIDIGKIRGNMSIGGFDGVLSNFCYFTEALSVQKIQDLHNGGPWGTNIMERAYYNFFGNTKKIIEYLQK